MKGVRIAVDESGWWLCLSESMYYRCMLVLLYVQSSIIVAHIARLDYTIRRGCL